MSQIYPKFIYTWKDGHPCVAIARRQPLLAKPDNEEIVLHCIGSSGTGDERGAKAAAVRNLRGLIRDVLALPDGPEFVPNYEI